MSVEPPGPVSPAVFAWRVLKLVVIVILAWRMMLNMIGLGAGLLWSILVVVVTLGAITDAVLHVLNQPSIGERVAHHWQGRFPPNPLYAPWRGDKHD